jgi:hypothetical protein
MTRTLLCLFTLQCENVAAYPAAARILAWVNSKPRGGDDDAGCDDVGCGGASRQMQGWKTPSKAGQRQ